MPSPVFSVVIPAYNAADTIDEALVSLTSQDCAFPYEIIVVDDGSTDATAAAVEKYGPKVTLIRKPHGGGPGAARNVGVVAATADLILFLDADDLALPHRLEKQVQFMIANRHLVDVSFGNWVIEGESDDYLARYGLESGSDQFVQINDAFARLLARGCFVTTSTSAIWRDLYLSKGKQAENHYYAEDYMFWCGIAASGGRFAYSNQPLSWYRTQRKGRLTLSNHTYEGEVWVLYEMLVRHGARLSREDHDLALLRFTKSADRLLRHEWSEKGRDAILARLDSLRPLVSSKLRNKWQILSLIPKAVPKGARQAIHRIRGVA